MAKKAHSSTLSELKTSRREILTLGAGIATIATFGLSGTVQAATNRIGYAMETFTVPRWKNLDKPSFEQAVQAAGYEPLVTQANFDVEQQLADVENLLTRGIDALALVAVVAEAGVNMVRRAKREGVPVVAYNTAVPSDQVDVYVARNNRAVGRKAVDAAAAAGVLSGNWVIVSGQAGNTVAMEITEGYMDVLQPLIDAGTVNLINQRYHEGWDPETARRQAEDALTATNNQINGFLCNNDGMAGGVIAALEQVGLAGKVFVSGQDATTEACRLILENKLTLSSFTRFDVMGQTAGELCVKLARGESLDISETYDAGNGVKIPFVAVEDFNVTRDNLVSYIKQYSPAYVDAQAIFQGIPKELWPDGAEALL